MSSSPDQITFLMRGCEEAKKFEKEKMDQPLTTFNSTKVSYLTNRGIPPGQGVFFVHIRDMFSRVLIPRLQQPSLSTPGHSTRNSRAQ
jgi:hypothetical protein